jgi:hypothetical protein
MSLILTNNTKNVVAFYILAEALNNLNHFYIQHQALYEYLTLYFSGTSKLIKTLRIPCFTQFQGHVQENLQMLMGIWGEYYDITKFIIQFN